MRRDGSGQASVPSVVCYFCVMRSDRHLDPFDGTFGEDEIPFLLLLSEHSLLDLARRDGTRLPEISRYLQLLHAELEDEITTGAAKPREPLSL